MQTFELHVFGTTPHGDRGGRDRSKTTLISEQGRDEEDHP